MPVLFRVFIMITVATSTLTFSQKAKAEAGREFLLSCTYGVLAGALVGAASLAVEDDPSSKVHRVARGASLGLYTGILLGLYVVYVVPAQLEAEEQEELDEQYDQVLEPDDYGQRLNPTQIKIVYNYKAPKFLLYPVIEQNQVTGAAMNYNVFTF